MYKYKFNKRWGNGGSCNIITDPLFVFGLNPPKKRLLRVYSNKQGVFKKKNKKLFFNSNLFGCLSSKSGTFNCMSYVNAFKVKGLLTFDFCFFIYRWTIISNCSIRTINAKAWIKSSLFFLKFWLTTILLLLKE